MNLTTKKLKDLLPADYNPRKDLQPGDPEYESLKKSIKRWGLVEPIVWNKRGGKGKGVVVGGHQRLKVLQAEGVKETEVVVVDLPEKEEKALNLALNKIQGAWDYPKLMLILDEMMIAPPEGMDIETTGFSMEDIAELEARTKKGQAQEDNFNAEEEALKIKKAETKLGDLWQLGEHRLLCGDATKEENVKQLMGGRKADLLLTDPPYGINVVSHNRIGITGGGSIAGKGLGIIEANVYKKIIGDDTPFDPSSIIKYGNTKIIFGANNFASKLPDNSHWLVWDKKCEKGADRNFFSDVELIWTNVKRKSCIIYRHLWSGLLREGDRKAELIGRVHPTQKPVGLIGAILKDYSKANDRIIDTFAGSGTTLIAAEQLGRRAYMMEIDPVYCDVCVKRWEKFTGKEARLTNRARGG